MHQKSQTEVLSLASLPVTSHRPWVMAKRCFVNLSLALESLFLNRSKCLFRSGKLTNLRGCSNKKLPNWGYRFFMERSYKKPRRSHRKVPSSHCWWGQTFSKFLGGKVWIRILNFLNVLLLSGLALKSNLLRLEFWTNKKFSRVKNPNNQTGIQGTNGVWRHFSLFNI